MIPIHVMPNGHDPIDINLPAVPREGEFLDIEQFEQLLRVTKVIWDVRKRRIRLWAVEAQTAQSNVGDAWAM